MRLLKSFFVICMVFVGTAGFSSSAHAETITVQVRSIAASKSGDGFDSKLNDLRGQLQKGFSGYSKFRQVGSSSFSIKLNDSHSMRLVNNNTMKLTFNGRSGRFIQLGLSIGSQLNTTLRASPGSTFFQAGMNYQDGILILAISVK